MNQEWECKQCGWTGFENELKFKPAENGCVSDSTIDLCPTCGSQKIFMK